MTDEEFKKQVLKGLEDIQQAIEAGKFFNPPPNVWPPQWRVNPAIPAPHYPYRPVWVDPNIPTIWPINPTVTD